MRFIQFEDVALHLRGKSVAIVGSGPGCAANEPGFVDSHDVVLRVNNYKLLPGTGQRTDIYYSFFGGSIKKSAADLQKDGVQLCMCKCPDAKFIHSPWHEARGKQNGTDFGYIYRTRANWWFCDTYVPTLAHFLRGFDLLGGHVPTTGFSAILDVLACEPKSVYITGFDFFASGLHNVDEAWRAGDATDPIGHVPAQELQWLASNRHRFPITTDSALSQRLENAN